jgi:hypothetical protein
MIYSLSLDSYEIFLNLIKGTVQHVFFLFLHKTSCPSANMIISYFDFSNFCEVIRISTLKR